MEAFREQEELPAIGTSNHIPTRSALYDSIVKASKREIKRQGSEAQLDSSAIGISPERQPSVNLDEVLMVEGALQMETKVAFDSTTPPHRMFAIPHDTILDEATVVSIYSSGYSRVPVYRYDPDKPKNRTAIVGILGTKQLIVVAPNENRPVSTLHLNKPMCISPKMNLSELLNRFQTGRFGHLALVCARPRVAQAALHDGDPIPEQAGFMGIITLEDVLECLLQEEIYDEADLRKARVARWAAQKWKRYVQDRKRKRANRSEAIHMDDVVLSAMTGASEGEEAAASGEGTALLGRGFFG